LDLVKLEAYKDFDCQEDSRVKTPKTIELFKERYQKQMFWQNQKERYKNPKGIENAENNFF